MKKTLALLTLLALLTPVWAVGQSTVLKRLSKTIASGASQIATCTSALTGVIFVASDGSDSTDCTTGSGSSANLCFCNGSTWTIASSGGGGGGETNVLASPDVGSEVDLINSVTKTGTALNLVSLEADDFTVTSNIVTIDDDSHAHTTTTLSGIDISADTNLAVTAPIVLTGDTVSIDKTASYVWTGVHDFGGGVVELPNGTGPTVDAAGETAVDTTADQLVIFGSAVRVLEWRDDRTAGFVGPDAADEMIVGKAQYDYTITDIHCITVGGTSIIMDLEQCTSTGGSCTSVDAGITCDANGAEDDGALSNASVTAGDWMNVKFGTESGTVVTATITWFFTVDRK